MQAVSNALGYIATVAAVFAVGTGLYVTGLGVFLIKAFGILLGHVVG